MDSKRRKICDGCNEEFSARYYRRHDCKNKKSASESCDNVGKTGSADSYDTRNDSGDEEQSTSYETPADVDHDVLSDGEEDAAYESDSGSELETVEDDLAQYLLGDNSDEEMEDEGQHKHIIYLLKIILRWKSAFFISDSAFIFVLFLIKSILYLLSSCEFGKTLYKQFPANMYQIDKFISFDKDSFIKYVVCSKCFCLYNFEDCVTRVEGKDVSKTCSNVLFPRHPMAHYRRPCGETLLKFVCINGTNKLVAKKTFCYKKIKESLHSLVKRDNFEEICRKWKERNVPDKVLMDIYDGRVWKEFEQKHNFFDSDRNYALMLNVDWFQPFKHTTYSVGAIYLAVLNLTREQRFKRENIILVGLIPDMKTEPPTNTFLGPLVDDLKEAWDEGFSLTSFESPNAPVKFRLALLCVGCDIPASRKLAGFLGHSATMGCNKCMKEFPGLVGQKNYGGFEISNWKHRNRNDHMKIVKQIVTRKTKGGKEEIEKSYGVRYSVLLELSYFDPVQMTIIDPMHNLFLGTAKRVISLWKDHSVLQHNDFSAIQEQVEQVECPADMGKLPQKFASSYGSYNADQWKNWTLIYSIFALKKIIPQSHLEYWRKFVLASKLLCTRTLTTDNVKVAHHLLISFCQMLQNALGPEVITPNMHMHAHLDECIYDFGPVYSFWLFSFERENGILGSVPTNKRFIEIQLMRNFLKHLHVSNIVCDTNLDSDFGPEFKRLLTVFDSSDRGTLGQCHSATYSYTRMCSRAVNVQSLDWSVANLDDISHSTLKNFNLCDSDVTYLQTMYSMLYPEKNQSQMVVCRSCRVTKEVNIFGASLGCKTGRSSRSSMILAYWCGDDGQIQMYNNMYLTPRPGQIQQFLLHNLIIDGESNVHVLAQVNWFANVDDRLRFYYGKPVEVWKSDLFEQSGPSSFIPVQRIKSKFAYAFQTLEGKNVVIVIPRERYLC